MLLMFSAQPLMVTLSVALGARLSTAAPAMALAANPPAAIHMRNRLFTVMLLCRPTACGPAQSMTDTGERATGVCQLSLLRIDRLQNSVRGNLPGLCERAPPSASGPAREADTDETEGARLGDGGRVRGRQLNEAERGVSDRRARHPTDRSPGSRRATTTRGAR